ncbi:WLM-domain-containing protein [Xylona heveae TC161]|uniref:WLM-domain-containing protein n=1 Tax=Xylona heveae (strain CBS 132557 / TC161) TaxID=1328760 RepID=A0A165I4W3_XYLHT|nr:WLM-domain-containing protein [Xylona heveae TC161]KZF24385.1 WLM-domain-containing protein [Xylona heveae TC161]
MPIGIQRLNARRLPPNERIIFIKPLEGPDKALAQDYLERIAAICVPIMRTHHLSIMTLEEYEPNMEFVGRNFNAGEVIQLVLKAPYTGHWLPFRYVQMVMMHELAHCVQMNHSGAFWKVRNQYADELRGLWTKNFTGEGMWSRGQTVAEDGHHAVAVPETETMPHSLCGGTYRSRRRKRRRGRAAGGKGNDGKELTYAEKKQRRIAKKFGINGKTLGNDEDARIDLEAGKIVKGKPRVANSARGRELRAAAALKRFGQQVKREEEEEEEEEQKRKEFVKKEEEDDEESDLDDEDDEDGEGVLIKEEEGEDALDWNGTKLLDSHGHGLIKVCEEEDGDNADVRAEMRELRQVNLDRYLERDASRAVQERDRTRQIKKEAGDENIVNKKLASIPPAAAPSSTLVSSDLSTSAAPSLSSFLLPRAKSSSSSSSKSPNEPTSESIKAEQEVNDRGGGGGDDDDDVTTRSCPICSLSNPINSLTCLACAHVLDLDKVADHWRCKSVACRGGNSGDGRSEYVNAGDCGRCGVCGARRDDQ